MKRRSFIDWAESAIAIRIQDGDFLFLGAQRAYKSLLPAEPVPLDRGDMIAPDTRVNPIDRMLDEAKRQKIEVIKSAASIKDEVKCYSLHGETPDEDDRDIFVVTDKELVAIADALRDGDYIFIIKEDATSCGITSNYVDKGMICR